MVHPNIVVDLQLTIKDLAVKTADLRVVANELDGNTSPAKVRSHREVRDRGNHGDGSGDVVEDAVLARLSCCESNESHSRGNHDRAHSPVPVRTANGDGNVSVGIVDGIVCE